eukprot:XP_011406897.1 PREDICTED: uncharacterized protein LOC105314427 [Amphimedon queenslandica]
MSQTAEAIESERPPQVERDPEAIVDALVHRARQAMAAFACADQARVDEAVTAIAWSLYKPENAKALAKMAVMDTGLGNEADKVIKNQRKTFGTLRDLMRVKSVGIIEQSPELGLVKYAKPVGVVGAVTPSTNPSATCVNKAMMALKGRNAIIVAPSPAGLATTTRTVDLMREALERIGAPEDLVQILPAPVDKALTQALMAACDLVVVTGSQNNVRSAYRSGTPAIGVGAGNVPVIVDSSADLALAAERIRNSKCFDNATSCSSENALVIVDDVYDEAIEALKGVGGYLADAQEKEAIRKALWIDGRLNRRVIARDIDILAGECGLGEKAKSARFLMIDIMSDAHFDRTNRLEDRQGDQEGRVGALEQIVKINAERLTEERKANAEERKAYAEERKANAEERKANDARLDAERKANDARLDAERKASRIERIIIIVAVAGAVAAPYIASLFGGGAG